MHVTARAAPPVGQLVGPFGALLLLAGCTVSGSTTGTRTESVIVTTAPAEVTTPAPGPTATSTVELVDPVVDTCRSKLDTEYPMTAQSTIGCDQPHLFETAYVGRFGPDATGPDRIEKALYDESLPVCIDRMGSYLGSADWRASSFWPYVYLPAISEWTAGARWFRCEVGRYTGEDSATYVISVTGSVRNVLADGGLGRYRRCLEQIGEDLRVVECAEPHHREVMDPIVDLGGVVPEHIGDDGFHALAGDICSVVLFEYLGTSRDDVSWWGNWPSEEEWDEHGDRTMRCSAVTAEAVTGSVKGIGDGPLAIAGATE